MRGGLVVDERLGGLQKEIARLSVEVGMLEAGRPSVKEYVEALRAYEEVEAGERELP